MGFPTLLKKKHMFVGSMNLANESLSHPRRNYQLESKIYIAKCLEMNVEVIAVVGIGEVGDETEMTVEDMEEEGKEVEEAVKGMGGGVEEEMMTGIVNGVCFTS